ncbi:hypothetical protein D3C72_1918310 [compost metagenome]
MRLRSREERAALDGFLSFALRVSIRKQSWERYGLSLKCDSLPLIRKLSSAEKSAL